MGSIAYWAIGYGLMFGTMSNGFIGTDGFLLGVGGADVAGLPQLVFWLFQLVFAGTAATIVSGAMAERTKFSAYLIYSVVISMLIYPIFGHWVWGTGWLWTLGSSTGLVPEGGFRDFAGSTVVHSVGGWAALMGTLLLGPRIGRFNRDGSPNAIPGHSVTLFGLGVFILWLGWFGFNGASQLAMGSVGDVADVSRIFANTNLAACGGAIAALILTQVLYGKVDLTMVLNGALAGLVSITAEPLTPTLGWAVIIGAVGGVIVVFAVPFLDRLKIDDVVGAIPVHLFCGVWGTMAVLLTNGDATFSGQLISIVIIGVFVVATSGVVWLVLNATMGLRCSPEQEMEGLDAAELGLEAYPEFGKGSQFA
jgi:Amt family ammonium transporter